MSIPRMYVGGGASPCKLPPSLTVLAEANCHQVDLAWSPPIPGQIFKVFRGADLIFSNLGNVFTDTPPANGQYTYVVTTETLKRNCRTQGITTVTVNKPTLTIRGETTCNQVTLFWSALDGATYQLSENQASYSVSGTTYTFYNVSPGLHTYGITAIIGGCTGISATASAVVNVLAYGTLITKGACVGSMRANTYANGNCGTYTSSVQDCAGCCPAAGTVQSATCVSTTKRVVTTNGCCGTTSTDYVSHDDCKPRALVCGKATITAFTVNGQTVNADLVCTLPLPTPVISFDWSLKCGSNMTCGNGANYNQNARGTAFVLSQNGTAVTFRCTYTDWTRPYKCATSFYVLSVTQLP